MTRNVIFILNIKFYCKNVFNEIKKWFKLINIFEYLQPVDKNIKCTNNVKNTRKSKFLKKIHKWNQKIQFCMSKISTKTSIVLQYNLK